MRRPDNASIRQILAPQRAAVFYALVGIPLSFGITTSLSGRGEAYLTMANLTNVLQQAAIPGLLAIFTTIVLITGNFDLSIGSTTALSAAIALRLIDVINPVLVIILCLVVGALVGMVNGYLVVYVGINAFIVTLATLTAIRGLVFIAAGQDSVAAEAGPLKPLANGDIAISMALLAGLIGVAVAVLAVLKRPRRWEVIAAAGALFAVVSFFIMPGEISLNHAVYITGGIAFAVWMIMRYTVVGRRVYAVGSNAQAARLAGIPVERYQAGAFVLNGIAAGFAGLMLAGLYQSIDPQVFTGQELLVITAAVLGGTSLFGGSGDVIKSVLGAVILVSLSNAMNFQNLSAAWQAIAQGSVLVIAAAIYTLDKRPERATRSRRRVKVKASSGNTDNYVTGQNPLVNEGSRQ